MPFRDLWVWLLTDEINLSENTCKPVLTFFKKETF